MTFLGEKLGRRSLVFQIQSFPSIKLLKLVQGDLKMDSHMWRDLPETYNCRKD